MGTGPGAIEGWRLWLPPGVGRRRVSISQNGLSKRGGELYSGSGSPPIETFVRRKKSEERGCQGNG